MAPPPGPERGGRAPAFKLPDVDGNELALDDLLGGGPVVLFFVPHPPRGVCKRTACRLRDEYSELREHGARVVGVSPYSRRHIARAIAQNSLPFPILADRDRTAHSAYGVSTWRHLLPGRATFVLDGNGTVRWSTRHPWNPKRHAEGALDAVRRLSDETGKA